MKNTYMVHWVRATEDSTLPVELWYNYNSNAASLIAEDEWTLLLHIRSDSARSTQYRIIIQINDIKQKYHDLPSFDLDNNQQLVAFVQVAAIKSKKGNSKGKKI